MNEEYPEAKCMDCGQVCHLTQELVTAPYAPGCGLELWCYCPACNVETFHPIPDLFNPFVENKSLSLISHFTRLLAVARQ